MASTKRRDTKLGPVQRASQLLFAARVILSVVGVAGAQNASASLVTINQTLDAVYIYTNGCPTQNDDGTCTQPKRSIAELAPRTNTVLNSDGRSKIDVSNVLKPAGVSMLIAEWNVDVDNGGKLKTYSNLRVAGDDGTLAPISLNNIIASASSKISFQDTVSSSDPRGEIFRFETRITGEFGSARDYQTSADFGPIVIAPEAEDLPAASFVHTATLTAGVEGEDNRATVRRQSTFRDPPGQQPGIFVESKAPIDFTLKFLDILTDASGHAIFAFDFSDDLAFALNGPDGNFWEIGMANDLLNTITSYASVYDKDGSLLPDARVVSSLGFSYAPLSDLNGEGGGGSSNVPAPAPAFLIAAGLLGMRLRRR